MWFNCALSCLIGLMMYMQPLAACFLLSILILHLRIRKQLPMLFIYGTVIIAGFFWMKTHVPPHASFNWMDNKIGTMESEIRLQDDLIIDGNLLSGTGDVKQFTVRFSYEIKTQQEQQLLLKHTPYFQRCHAVMEVEKPLPNTNALKFNYADYLQRQDIQYTVKLKQLNSCHATSLSIVEQLERYRMVLSDQMNRLNGHAMHFVSALTVGDLRFLSALELNELKQLGIYHLYAISGSHVALLSVQLFYILKRCYLPMFYSRLIILIAIPGYLILTGFSPSVIRSGLFIMIYMLGRPLKLTMLDSLSVAFLLLMIINPLQIDDVGFQLSFFISLLLILTTSQLTNKHPVYVYLITTMISQFSSLPILLLQFNSFQWTGFITNLLFIPLFTFIIFPLCTLVLLFLMVMHDVPDIVLACVDWSFQLNDTLTELFLRWKIADYILGNQPAVVSIALFAAIFFIFYYSRFEMKRFTLYSLSFVLLLYSLPHFQSHADSVTFLDVGQGDSAVIESAGKVMVVDTGGRMTFDREPWQERKKSQQLSDYSLIPFLKERGYQHIDYLVLTHPDEDHFGEAKHLLENIEVRHLIINPLAPGVEKYDRFKSLLDKTVVLDVKKMRHLLMGQTNIALMTAEQADDENASSIVMKVVQGRMSYLLTGDLPIDKEMMIPCEHADILKVGHHGSRTSTSEVLLDCIRPSYAVISAGRSNRFGHPHKEVVELLQKRNIHVFNTQYDGRVTFKEQYVFTAAEANKKTGQSAVR